MSSPKKIAKKLEKFKNITPTNINKFNDYKAANLDDSLDKWKTYLYEDIQGELRKRLINIINLSEYKLFFEGLKYEYGYGVEKNLDLALSLYIKSSGANSKNYLSMSRLYDIYRNNDKFNIKKDKNLEMIYLIKSFTYYPISFFNNNSNIRFPINPYSAIFLFLQNNFKKVNGDICDKFLFYIDELIKIEEYKNIISMNDYNLIKGFIEGMFGSYDLAGKTSYDTLIAMSLEGNLDATYKLIGIYIKDLNKIKKNEKEKNSNETKKKEELQIKIFDLFQILENNKYYKAYAEYGYFLYNEMRIFDKALQIFEEGYKNNQIDCALYYFCAFTKSENQKIYDKNNFDYDKFTNILQPLIDSFIIGESYSLTNIFDFFHIVGKKYNLTSKLTSKYMNYLNEIAELCLKFTDKEKGDEYCKRFSPLEPECLKNESYKALSTIYMHGLTKKVRKNLIKAENCLNKILTNKENEYSHPFYTRLKYKIQKNLFNLGVIDEPDELITLEKKVFNLYEKYKDYENYGNSYYYYFGKIYEKGIGVKKDDEMAYFYYQKGCNSLNNLFNQFIIVYKRYQSLNMVNSEKFKNFNPNKRNNNNYNVIFRLSLGETDINLLVNDNMTFKDIKTELYKRQEFQNLNIKLFLYGGRNLQVNEKIGKYKIKENDKVLVVVDDGMEILYQ